jgi:sugar/nucleoside kinase (ribokinase family)
MFDLVGIGNPVYDIIITPRSRTNGRVLSGCSTNACLAGKRLGLQRVGMVGCVGPDFATRISNDMKNHGLEISLNSTEGETGGFRLIYDERGDRTLDVLGVANKIGAEGFPEEYLDAKFILVGPILGEVDLRFLEFLRSSSKATIYLDPQGMIRTIGKDGRIFHECNYQTFKNAASAVDFIKPNEHEGEIITGEKDPVKALLKLRDLGSAVPIVTLADRGSILLNGDELYRIPAFTTTAIDPTGAGDVYAGSFITEYLRTNDIIESALFASAAASIMVEQVGPDFSMSAAVVEKRKSAIRGRIAKERLV